MVNAPFYEAWKEMNEVEQLQPLWHHETDSSLSDLTDSMLCFNPSKRILAQVSFPQSDVS